MIYKKLLTLTFLSLFGISNVVALHASEENAHSGEQTEHEESSNDAEKESKPEQKQEDDKIVLIKGIQKVQEEQKGVSVVSSNPAEQASESNGG